MKRIFSVRLNLDDMAASLEFLEGDAALAEWLRGFRYGLRGAPSRWDNGPGSAGFRVGSSSLAEAHEFQLAKSDGGKKSAEARKEKTGTAQPARTQLEDTSKILRTQLEDTSTKSDNSSNQSLIVNPSIYNLQSTNDNPKDTLAQPAVERVPVEPDLFHEFWALYDKSKGKDRAIKKWASLSMKVRKTIMEALPAYVQSTPDKQYRMDPTTYLNGKRWEDEIVSADDAEPQHGSDAWFNWHAARGTIR